MAKDETRRMKPSDLATDLEIYAALKAITNYAPANAAYTQAAVNAVYDALIVVQELEVQAAVAYDTARDNLVAKQWELHNMLLGVKDQVQAQFGPNSNELQSLKRKKKTEYKSPKPRTPKKE